jgi:hypothetical protein
MCRAGPNVHILLSNATALKHKTAKFMVETPSTRAETALQTL